MPNKTAQSIVETVRQSGVTIAQQLPEITEFVAWLLQRDPAPERIVEIGAHMGGTTAIWCEIADTQMISVDLPGGSYGGVSYDLCEARNDRLSRQYPHFIGVLGNSRALSTVALVERVLTGPVDLLFIDGDHTYDGVRSDYTLYHKFVRPGGVILFHDIEDTPYHRNHHEGAVEVYRLWQELQGEKHEFTIHSGWCGLGALVV